MGRDGEKLDVWTEGPQVQIVSLPKFYPLTEWEIPDDGSDALKLGAFAAKGCYDSYGKTGRSNQRNQEKILLQRHGSVLEHINISVFIWGISRACSMELNRHRHLAISQRSTRYVDESNSSIILSDHLLRAYNNDPESLLVTDYIATCKRSLATYQNTYQRLLQENPNGLENTALRKWARSIARGVLPNCIETRGTYTGNIRAWRWIILSRSSPHADTEIQELAARLLSTFRSTPDVEFFFRSIVDRV